MKSEAALLNLLMEESLGDFERALARLEGRRSPGPSLAAPSTTPSRPKYLGDGRALEYRQLRIWRRPF